MPAFQDLKFFLFNPNRNIYFLTIILGFFLLIYSSCESRKVASAATVSSLEETAIPSVNNSQIVIPQITSSTAGPNNIIRNLLQDKNGIFWFPSWDGIFKYDGKIFTNFNFKEEKNGTFFSVMEAEDGDIWFGSLNSGVYLYDGENWTHFNRDAGLSSLRIYCMTQDKKGNVWLGTSNGISIYDKASKKFFSANDLRGIKVLSILEDQTGKIWFGTEKGISTYTPQTINTANQSAAIKEAKFTAFNKSDPSVFEGVSTMIESKNGAIWIGSFGGLFKYDLEKNKSGKQEKTLTLIANNPTQYLQEDGKGNIWFSADDLSIKDPTSVLPPMALYHYQDNGNQKNITKVISKSAEFDCQVFGIIEDQEDYIWFGTVVGICRYDPNANELDGQAFTYFSN